MLPDKLPPRRDIPAVIETLLAALDDVENLPVDELTWAQAQLNFLGNASTLSTATATVATAARELITMTQAVHKEAERWIEDNHR